MGVGIVICDKDNSFPEHSSIYVRPDDQKYDNNIAEIDAATIALDIVAASKNYKGQKVTLYTDSQAVMEELDKVKKGDKPTTFLEKYENLYSIAEWFPHGIQFIWVKAHDKDTGNNRADALAAKAIRSKRSSTESSSKPLTGTTQTSTREDLIEKVLVKAANYNNANWKRDLGNRRIQYRHNTQIDQYLPSRN